jgi:hypothetical protein
LRPYAVAPDASVAARRVFAVVATSAGSYARGEEALALIAAAQRALASIGALDGSDIAAAADYATTLEYQALTEWRMGRIADLERSTAQGLALADRVLAARPGHLRALAARVFLKTLSAGKLLADMHYGEALQLTNESYADAQLSLQLDPANVDTRGRVARNRVIAANEYLELGRPRMAITAYRQHIEALSGGANGFAGNADQIIYSLGRIAVIEADLGDPAASAAALEEAKKAHDALSHLLRPDNARLIAADLDLNHALVGIALSSNDAGAALATAKASRAKILANDLSALSGGEVSLFVNADRDLGQAEFEAGDFAAADAAFTAGLHDLGDSQEVFNQRDRVRFTAWRAIVLAHLGQVAAAQELIGPALAAARQRNAHNHDAEDERLVFASLLYAQALVDAGHRNALLGEADGVIDALPREMREMRSTQVWRERIRRARRDSQA